MSDYWMDLPTGPRADGTEPTPQAFPFKSGDWVIERQRDGRWAFWEPTKDDQFGPFPRSYAASAKGARDRILAWERERYEQESAA
jgi:hypothetical protein